MRPRRPEYTAIFSAKECGLSVWITKEIAAGRGSERTAKNETLGSLDGLDIKAVETQLLPDQLKRWREFRDGEQEALKEEGKGCGALEMVDVVLRQTSAQGATIRAPAFLHYIYYDEAWFFRSCAVAASRLRDDAAHQPPSRKLRLIGEHLFVHRRL